MVKFRSCVTDVLSIDTTTNQRLAAAGGGIGDKMQQKLNVWGGLFPVVWCGKWGNKK